MGFRFRKSINLGGGFKINLSKSGVGYSWGTKGFRITKSAKGTTRKTFSIPGTGISYVQESGKSDSKTTKQQPVQQMNTNHINYDTSTSQQTSVCGMDSTIPSVRRGMKAWAIVCFILAAIYALMTLSVGTMLLGMTAFCAVFGVMFLVLSKSPKSNPFLLGKQSGMTKKTFVIICVVIAFCSFALLTRNSNSFTMPSNNNAATVPTNSPTNAPTNAPTFPTKGEEINNVTYIADFKTTEYDVCIGESLNFTVDLKPGNLTADNVTVETSNAKILSVSGLKFVSTGTKTILSFQCTALSEGEATLIIKSKNSDKTSNTAIFNISTPPIVTAIGKFSPSNITQEVGDKTIVTCYMRPIGLTLDDFDIENSNTSILRVSNIVLSEKNEQTALTFEVSAVGEGKAAIQIVGADGRTESNKLQFTIKEKDTSPTVYVTPYGEKYHFSKACAGKNAIETTQKQAINSGKGRCKKCG